MATTAGRVVLGVFAALAVVGGAALVVMVIIYFGASEYVPELTDYGGWGVLAGMCALAVYVAGAFRASLIARIGAGLVAGGAGYAVSSIVAFLVSLTVDPGGEQGNLEDGTLGFLWLAVGAYMLWRLAARRWPVAQLAVSEAER